MQPLERWFLDKLLEEKAQLLGTIFEPVMNRCKNAGSYDDDEGRGMQIDASDLYGGSTLYADLFVNKRGRILVFSYVYDPQSYDEDEGVTEEESEASREESLRWQQGQNPDQLHLPLGPVQRTIRFLHPLEIAESDRLDAHFWTYRFEILVRYLPENGHWDILWKGNPRTIPLPCDKSGDTVEESVALRYVRDLLEIIERKDRY